MLGGICPGLFVLEPRGHPLTCPASSRKDIVNLCYFLSAKKKLYYLWSYQNLLSVEKQGMLSVWGVES